MDDRALEADESGRLTSLRERPAGAVTMTHFLRLQARAAPRSIIARIFGASVLSDESRSRYFDVIGELAVAEALGALDEGWVVMHAIPVDSREVAIDHVVIGPGGVFTLNSNYHARQSVSVADHDFHVAGAQLNHIHDTEFDVARVERRLSAAAGQPVHVVGVIVVVEPRSMTLRDVPAGIAVVQADELVAWLGTRPLVLDPRCVSAVVEVAERPSSWMLGELSAIDGPRLVADFAIVHREVRTATIAYRSWLVTVSAGLIGILVIAVSGALERIVTG